MKCNFVRRLAAVLAWGVFALAGAERATAQATGSLGDSGSAVAGGYLTDDLPVEPASYVARSATSALPSAAAYVPPPLPTTTRNYVRAEYLQWWIKGNQVPPLLTTSPGAGVLPAATVLVGDERLDGGLRLGGRLTAGHWFDDDQILGVEFSLLGLGGDDTNIGFASGGLPILARPFIDFNQVPPQENAQLIAFPSIVAGNINFATSSEFYSANVLLRQNWRRGARSQIDLLGGYRYARFRESLLIQENFVGVFPPVTFNIRDSFATATDFHGGEIGFIAEYYEGPLSLSMTTKLAIGGVRQSIAVEGQTVRSPPRVETPGGLLAQPSNSGRFTNHEFALLPELNLNAGYQLTPGIAFTVGYNLLFLTEVARTGDQIDRRLDLTQNRDFPTPNWGSTTLWAQGVQAGIELKF